MVRLAENPFSMCGRETVARRISDEFWIFEKENCSNGNSKNL